jgi:hypothetical protein
MKHLIYAQLRSSIPASRVRKLTPGSGTFLLPANLTDEHALKARSISAQGNTLGKPASLGSCALQGRRSLFPHVSISPVINSVADHTHKFISRALPMKPNPPLETLILTLRQEKVILDADLAGLYGLPTKVLNQAVKRNSDRFPEDFCFQLTAKEWANLKSQIGPSSSEPAQTEGLAPNWSQFVTSSKRHRGAAYRPYAFTEHGAIMAATVLNSREAVTMSLYVVRAFIQMRQHIAANAEVLKRLAEIDQTLLKHDKSLQIIWRELQPLLHPPPAPPPPEIGFHVKEDATPYRTGRKPRLPIPPS